MKKIFSIILVINMLLALVACGSNSKLVGRWFYVDDSSSEFPSLYEVSFYSDGTCSYNGLNGTYVIDGNRIKISTDKYVILEGQMTIKNGELTVAENGSSLTMYNESSMKQKPTKQINEKSLKEYIIKNGLLFSDIDSMNVGDVIFEDGVYFCTVNYIESNKWGIGNSKENEKTLIWFPEIEKWCSPSMWFF